MQENENRSFSVDSNLKNTTLQCLEGPKEYKK